MSSKKEIVDLGVLVVLKKILFISYLYVFSLHTLFYIKLFFINSVSDIGRHYLSVLLCGYIALSEAES